MYTSATERTAFGYLAATLLAAAFGGIYEVFSHGIWSFFMVYAFAFPLLLGALPFAWLALRKRPLPCCWACRMHHAGVATLTMGSLVEGILAIYGATNHLTRWYWLVGIGLVALAQGIRLFRKSSIRKPPAER